MSKDNPTATIAEMFALTLIPMMESLSGSVEFCRSGVDEKVTAIPRGPIPLGVWVQGLQSFKLHTPTLIGPKVAILMTPILTIFQIDKRCEKTHCINTIVDRT